jgi:ribose transport system ATP-binding protein
MDAAVRPAGRGGPPRLEMRGVSRRFGATIALRDVDLTVHAGAVHALVGENGAGKSTLMKVLSGAYRPDAGTMLLDGQPYAPRSPMAARRSGVAMIYQELSLAPHLSVEANITLGVEPCVAGFLRRGGARRQARNALAQLGHPDIHPAARVASLSMAQRQIVEVARAVAVGCRVLVLDEPTSSLSLDDVARLFRLVARLREQGHAVVYISHFIEEVKEVADRVTVLRDGAAVGSGAADDLSASDIVAMMVGREVEELYPRSPREPGEVVLSVGDLSGVRKPQGVTFQLRRGEVLGIAGLVGAGRTELLRAIFGLDPVKSGLISLAACAGPASPSRRWLQGAGYLSEDRKGEGLATSLSVSDNVTLSRLTGFGPPGFVIRRRQDAAVAPWLERLGIRCRSPRQHVSDLSGGNQQKVAMARLLQHDADVLLLDEPTRGIDVASKATIYRIIDELAAQKDAAGRPLKAVLMVSSYLPELLGVCDRIAVMHRGRLMPARPAEDLDEHQLMMRASGREGTA